MHLRTAFTILFILFSFSTAGADSGKRVLIDPGHGGSDPGVSLSGSVNEKDIVLEIALMIKEELSKYKDIHVSLTRYTDAAVPSGNRINAAKSFHADMFVSIHVNAGFKKDASGYEVYYTGAGNNAGDGTTSQDIIKDMTKNKSLNKSVRLAQLIEKNMQGIFKRKSRGVREAPVLEGLTVPAVLVEVGFATNAGDRKKLLDPETRRAIAGAITKSIKEAL